MKFIINKSGKHLHLENINASQHKMVPRTSHLSPLTSHLVCSSDLLPLTSYLLSYRLNPSRLRSYPNRVLHIIDEDFTITYIAFRGIIQDDIDAFF